MNSPFTYPVDDKDLDDAALWAVIDSAAAASLSSSSSKSRKSLPLRHSYASPHSPTSLSFSGTSSLTKFPCRSPTSGNRHHRNRNSSDGEVLYESFTHVDHRPQKMARLSCVSELAETSPGPVFGSTATPSPPMLMVKHVQRTPNTVPVSDSSAVCYEEKEERVSMTHCLSGRFPTVSLFKEYQNAAVAILEKSDYTLISGSPYIKKSGWRKISCFFNISYEIKDKTIEFDENRNVQRAEFVVRAYMQGGRFSDGWGSCELREKRFQKPNNDIPSTAETRAKNKACQDLLGIGACRPGACNAPR